MSSRTRRSLFSATLFLAICGLAGMAANQRLRAQSASDESTLRDSLHKFTDAYAVPGVGTADCSIYRGTIAQLAAHAYH